MSLKETEHDKGTTRFVGAALGTCWFVLFLSLPANYYGIGSLWPSLIFNIIGTAIMFLGLSLRLIAARTLGKFYSRTLRTKPNQKVVSEGTYRFIRHPGYLGMIVLFAGAALTVANFIVLVVVAAVIVTAYVRRIAVEENMLITTLGKEYVEYMGRTKKLLPFIY
jgi:protein-S-isoprenylcysteine O-methyltransferase Ste14